ncbi:hypothetical protein JGH11_14555 [Dysgonomonas sp. Marseille-P4677]|uniref:hypothetical protein n=1 Tax=Dysgonomonas sp. Marseille-P4677 TaxID=2364790 RepID=UPI0019131BD1|nr:hypothetical protein [Dysgonomonas sp. Marseille-P4677]MBK5722096.1 hypothetical protein [Dysgonomonas sp. Marseille-P4677]
MKTKNLILLIITFVALGFVSCSSDDDKERNSEGLEGTWKAVYSQGYYMENGVKVEEWDGEVDDDDVIVFKSNGKMRFEIGDELIEDDYTYKNGKISLENYYIVFNVLKHTDTDLILELKLEIDGDVIYEKQTLKRIS